MSAGIPIPESKRQEIFELAAKGLPQKQIAAQANVCRRTVQRVVRPVSTDSDGVVCYELVPRPVREYWCDGVGERGRHRVKLKPCPICAADARRLAKGVVV